MAEKKLEEVIVQGVPKETPARNCFEKLAKALEPVLGRKEAAGLINAIKKAGYFELGLIDQSRLIVDSISRLGNGDKMSRALLGSPSDKIRSLGVRVHFEHFKGNVKKELASLKITAAMPGTWTQETSQSTLKDMVHLHGLDKILPLIKRWVEDDDPTVRRVIIEGLRPRGVWCKHIGQLKADPSPLKPIIKQLLDDDSDYVRKAVANSLNDISKDNPDSLCEWIAEWSKGKIGAERKWIIQRALRTLVKVHHPQAMKLIGLDTDGAIELKWSKGTPAEIEINQGIPFSMMATNKSKAPAKARIQLEMIGPSRSGKLRKAKYLLGNVTLDGGESISIEKKIKFAHKNFVPKIPGKYVLHVQCNGRTVGERVVVYRGRDLG